MTERKSIRFIAEDNTLALLDLSENSQSFKPSIVALVVDEAMKGSGLVMLKKNAPVGGQSLAVQVGDLAVVQAKVVWIRELDEHVVRIGLQIENEL
ncbi:MAG: hypothetical protein AB8E15_10300 [Bdellovibrionales bacterium]